MYDWVIYPGNYLPKLRSQIGIFSVKKIALHQPQQIVRSLNVECWKNSIDFLLKGKVPLYSRALRKSEMSALHSCYNNARLCTEDLTRSWDQMRQYRIKMQSLMESDAFVNRFWYVVLLLDHFPPGTVFRNAVSNGFSSFTYIGKYVDILSQTWC